jgi:carbon monoxide dehydrogenase subunit G
MKLSNEFTVAVPLERAWATLLDIERVASFLPGAKIEAGGDDGVYHGSMRVKVGPIVTNYQGTARLLLADEQERVADISVEAREAKGQGTAAAVIHNRLVEHGGGTRVIAETDLQVTGRQAQFGRGIMQDVAGRMLGDFARRFESYLLEGDDNQPAPGVQQGPSPPEAPEALDLGSVLYRTPALRYGAGAVLALLILLGLRMRKVRAGA